MLQSATPVLLCSATPVALLKWSESNAGAPGAPAIECRAARRPGNRTFERLHLPEPAEHSNTTRQRRDWSPVPSASWAGCDTTTPTALWTLSQTCPHAFWHGATEQYSTTTLHQYYRDYCKVRRQYYSALVSITPVITGVISTKCHSSATLYYKVLLQHYKVLLQYHSVLQSTTPVLLCNYWWLLPRYYSVLINYKVPLQHRSVLQSTTPVLVCTTKCYSSTPKCHSSTTLYYKVLPQYYCNFYKVLLCTTKYCSSTTKCYSSTRLYYKVLLQ